MLYGYRGALNFGGLCRSEYWNCALSLVLYTPAAVPFGMAKLAPSTDAHLGNSGGWQAVGYDFRHTSIEGFANFHEFQVGGIDFCADCRWVADCSG